MPVNEKMTATIRRLGPTPRSYYKNNQCHVISSEEAAQAVVNAAWTRFDKDDESTWPDESAEFMLVLCNNDVVYAGDWRRDGKWWWDGHSANPITHWANPDDLKLLHVRDET